MYKMIKRKSTKNSNYTAQNKRGRTGNKWALIIYLIIGALVYS